MKSYKEYLVENKKTYSFKVKIAGECPKDCGGLIKSALSQFDVASVSSGKSTPITAQQHEFPEHKNIEITIFDVVTNYPATNKQVQDKISHVIGKGLNDIRVRNEVEEREIEINHKHDEKTGRALVGTQYEASDNQDKVGVKYAMNFLKELEKNKLELEEIKGVNDQLFPKAAPYKEQKEQSRSTEKSGMKSPVGTNHTKLSPVVGGTKNSLNVPARKVKG
jgi:hypothetical protein